MNKKKIIALSQVIVLTLLFSGCSFRGASDGGVFRSDDGGNTFEKKIKAGEKATIANESILDLEIDKNDTNVLYIGTISTGIWRSINGGDDWVRAQNNFTNVEDIEISPEDPNKLFVAALVGGRGKIMKTVDGGNEWVEIFTQRAEGARVTSLAIDKKNPRTIYAGDTLGGIYKTFDEGETWQTLLWAKNSIRKIAIDNLNSNRVYFVIANSGIMRTDDAGSNFGEIKTSKTVYNVLPHPKKEGSVYISDGNGLQKSVDSGETLQQINTLVKPEKLGSRGLAVNPDNDNEIYFASGKAFYKTVNGGQTWKTIQFNTSRIIEIVRVDPSDTQVIYIGTSAAAGNSSGLQLFPTLP